jgi:hypothetical protein
MTNREAAAEEYIKGINVRSPASTSLAELRRKFGQTFSAGWDARQPEIDRLKEAIDKLKVAYDLLRESADR